MRTSRVSSSLRCHSCSSGRHVRTGCHYHWDCNKQDHKQAFTRRYRCPDRCPGGHVRGCDCDHRCQRTILTRCAGHGAILDPRESPGRDILHRGATRPGAGDVTVYDVAAKVDGVSIDARHDARRSRRRACCVFRSDTSCATRACRLRRSSAATHLRLRFLLKQRLDRASATRPGEVSPQTRASFRSARKDITPSIFRFSPTKARRKHCSRCNTISPTRANTSSSLTCKCRPTILWSMFLKGIEFAAAEGSDFQSTQEDPRVQTFVAKSVHPGQAIGFTVSGEGQMVRDTGGAGMGQQPATGDAAAGDIGTRPGGGIGAPIGAPDPLTRYKWWLLGCFAFLLATAAAFFLRSRGPVIASASDLAENIAFDASPAPARSPSVAAPIASSVSHTTNRGALLNVLKDELFAIESEKLSGALSPDEYAAAKAGLEAVLKRTLKDTSASGTLT